MTNENKLRSAKKLYQLISEEIARKEYHPIPKAKALAAAQGDKHKLKSLYITFRYAELRSQLEAQPAQSDEIVFAEDDPLYQQIKAEIVRKEYHPQAKAQAIASAQGQQNRLKNLYLKFRYEALLEQQKQQQEFEKQQKLAVEQELIWQQDIKEQQEIAWQQDLMWQDGSEQIMTDESKPLFEQEIYRTIATEMAHDDYHAESMARAIEQAEGNKEGLKALYVKYRYAKLSTEAAANNPQNDLSPAADEMYLIICEEISGKKRSVAPEVIVSETASAPTSWLEKLLSVFRSAKPIDLIAESDEAKKPLSASEIYQLIGEEMARKEYYPSAKSRASLEARGNDHLLKSLYVRFRYEELSGQTGQSSTPESEIYQIISDEMARKEYHVEHQKRAVLESQGDNSKLKSLYIQFRYADLSAQMAEKWQKEFAVEESKTATISAQQEKKRVQSTTQARRTQWRWVFGVAEVVIVLLWLSSDSILSHLRSSATSAEKTVPIPSESHSVAQYRIAAEQGNANAQFTLGQMYEVGKEINQDKTEAAAWYRKAAEQGHLNAQFKLGVLYTTGQGVAKNPTEAAVWYRKAADQGMAFAQFALGNMYELGSGVSKDDAQAVAWYRLAADQGDANAQFNLGIMYANGRGILRDPIKAVALFRKSAAEGFVSAQFNLGVMYALGQYVAKDEAQAVMWFRKAAEQGDKDAQFKLAVMYENGKGTPKDDTQAFIWYKKSAEQGLVNAQFKLGVMFATGQGIAASDAQAAVWFQKAADQGDADAQFNLGTLYEAGRGVAQDKAAALSWYQKAAEQGFVNAQFNLGVMYAMGRDVVKDDAQAMMWFRKAAEQGDVDAQTALMHLEEQQQTP